MDAEADGHIGPQRPLPVAHSLRQHIGHAQITLDRSNSFSGEPVDANPRPKKITEHGDFNPCFAKRRQHLLDVGKEQSIGADDEHTLPLKGEPVGVEQVGGAMERHDGLACAGTTLDQQHAGHRCPDDLVLFALDSGDDVTEPAGARRLNRGDQRALTLDLALAIG